MCYICLAGWPCCYYYIGESFLMLIDRKSYGPLVNAWGHFIQMKRIPSLGAISFNLSLSFYYPNTEMTLKEKCKIV